MYSHVSFTIEQSGPLSSPLLSHTFASHRPAVCPADGPSPRPSVSACLHPGLGTPPGSTRVTDSGHSTPPARSAAGDCRLLPSPTQPRALAACDSDCLSRPGGSSTGLGAVSLTRPSPAPGPGEGGRLRAPLAPRRVTWRFRRLRRQQLADGRSSRWREGGPGGEEEDEGRRRGGCPQGNAQQVLQICDGYGTQTRRSETLFRSKQVLPLRCAEHKGMQSFTMRTFPAHIGRR